MVKKWDVIYELRGDAEHIRRVQNEIANRPGYGLATTPSPFGSEEWWAALDSGSIERRSVEGTITEVHPVLIDERPEFRMRSDDGAERTGTRQGDPTRYVEGLRVRVEYVTFDRRPDASPELGTTADVVLAVRIEHSHKRTPLRPHSFYGSPPSPI
jgi:hypothetical protein